MPLDRVITFPAEATQRLADRFQDENWFMDGDEASDIARDIVIDITEAVDTLRGSEKDRLKQVMLRCAEKLEMRGNEEPREVAAMLRREAGDA